jgi:UDP-N-acetylglucosamine--N-acetylmuramyl-(pentapeptide) pyrophosphoryl-undecaprenol N-acetylglucosamine transferase
MSQVQPAVQLAQHDVPPGGQERRAKPRPAGAGSPLKAMIMAGGTGGHVYPALAVARQLLAWGVDVLWLGTRNGLEARVVPATGIPIVWLSVGGVRGKDLRTRLFAPVQVGFALGQAWRILSQHRPDVVLGMGGFAAGPGGLAACLVRKPLVIHEQNALAGITNRLLAPLATRVLEGFPGVFRRQDASFIGNPVRAEIAALAPPEQRMDARSGRLRLLVLGGSLGAKRLNDVVPEALRLIPPEQRPEVWHQAGHAQIDGAVMSYRLARVEARVDAFIDDMAAAYGWCDLVVCRAGALTIAELAAAGVGAILVPYPFAVDDHQAANARFLTGAGAAMMMRDDQLEAPTLAAMLGRFVVDGAAKREPLLAMALAARQQARTDAAEQVARICVAAAGRSLSQGCRGAGEAP